MSKIGGGVTLLVIGAILTFALHVNIPGLGEYALGVILMLGGLLLIGLWFATDYQRRRTHTVVEERHPPVVEERGTVVEERPVVEQRRRRTL